MDVVCPRCGASIPAHARFCMSCGAPLDAAAPPVEERRLVSILFADLVGFTARSDEADPEDVRRTLVPFHERAKDAIERYGGTLDKFIGDAAMGVFGAPVAHGDDAERAVRAALDLLGSMRVLSQADPDVAVRVAVNTGEAVVAFGEGPQVGEAVAGDVVNTASRMQAVAPRDGLVIGEETWRSVRERFATEERDAVSVKGKATPIRIWRVVGERRTAAPEEVAPLVGRVRELAMLRERLRLADVRRAPEVVTIVADPGVGKTRLTQEFRRELGSDVSWFAGACLPYGDGVTFRALVDVVRAAAGIDRGAEGDAARIAVGSLAGRVAVDPSDRAWLLGRLEPLLGVSLDGEPEGERPDASARESAAACARILAHAAGDGPIVVELEDLHWAEAGLLEAIEHLVRALEGTSALVLCTARPEFAERNIGWRGDTIRLSELTAEETRALLHELLRRDGVADEVEDALLERAGGNPLYALEFVRMLSDTGRGLVSDAVPTSVHGVIAARLDAIPAEHRALLQDASVVGTVFWPAALDALATGPRSTDEGVRELLRRGMVTLSSPSRLPEQPEYGFTHALIREVAYGRLPRSARARKHLAVGRWLEDEARGSVEDLAPMLANHFAVAAELAQAAGETAEADAARDPAIRWLFAAGDAASRIDESDAFTLFERARALAPPGSPSFSEALWRSGIAGRRTHRLTGAEVLDRYDASLVIERRDGDPARIGGALVRLGSQLAVMGEGERATTAFDEAVELLEAIPPGVELARACAFRAEEEMFAGRPEVSLGWAERAIELGRALHAEDVVVMALHIRGDDRCTLGDVEGLEDFEEALSIAQTRGSASNLVISHTYVGEWRWLLEGPAAALPAYEEAMAVAERRGSLNQGTQAKMVALGLLSDLGEWDRALRWTDELLGLGPGQLDLPFEIIVRAARSWLSLMRGITDDLDDPRELVERARPTRTLQVIARVLAVAASLALARGDRAYASDLLREFDEVTRDVASTYRATNALTVMRVCADLGDVGRAHSIAGALDVGTPYERIHMDTAAAYARELEGDVEAAEAIYAAVVPRWETFRCPFESAAAALGRGRCLLALVRPEQARAALRAARATFAELGALPWVARVDAVGI
ncbi:MAG TPA: adenylate/guanylate cyclase domain-containing protein [Actinomycetota bacterium]|nr:adenylate/guanylate cyclase domain-containing protein [Actinomycetota bacterium]